MAPIVDREWCERTPIRPVTASQLLLRPCHANTFTISHFGLTQESVRPWCSAQVVVIHSSFAFLPYK